MTAEVVEEPSTVGVVDKVARTVRRVPYTTGVVALMIVLGVVTRALWDPLEGRPLLDSVAYGLPALHGGRWWTPVTGAFFALVPALHVPIIRHAEAPWHGRLRGILVGYAVITVLYIGLLWDVEHLIAIVVGLAIVPALVGRTPRLERPRLSRHEWRVVASTFFVATAAIRVLLYVTPSHGPLGATSTDTSALGVLVSAGISLLLANGLRQGSRRTWHLAGALSTLSPVAGLVMLTVEVAAPDQLDASGAVVSSVPELTVGVLLSMAQLGVLVVGRSAFQARSKRRRRTALASTDDDRQTAIALLKQHGVSTMSWMGTWPDNDWYLHRDGAGTPFGHPSATSPTRRTEGSRSRSETPMPPTPRARGGARRVRRHPRDDGPQAVLLLGDRGGGRLGPRPRSTRRARG